MRCTLLPLLLLATSVAALEPKEVYVVANKDMQESLAVANHYVEARKVPVENIITLSLPTGDDISRADYDAKLAGPLREALKDKKAACQVLLTVYGVPLRVGPKVPTADEKKELEAVQTQLNEARNAGDKKREMELTEKQLSLSGDQSTAAVDSELMLLWWPKYDPTRWIINPRYWQVSEEKRKQAPPVLITCRLDGPTPEIAQRLVDDALEVEEKGLSGKAYFDARGQKYDPKNVNQATGYEGYDESFREAAALMKQAGLDVTLDDKEALFAANTCPTTALYAGWYSLANYVDCCSFEKGAVAWHLASAEAVTLHDPKSKLWCPNLLKKGVAVTLGPVGEPYTVGFPKPAEFFGFLVTGKYTVAECYSRTVVLTSWQMILIGDPLYNPFAKTPKLKESDVIPSPKGSQVLK
jgi:uncharacterized protein (TIGR03790 family)